MAGGHTRPDRQSPGREGVLGAVQFELGEVAAIESWNPLNPSSCANWVYAQCRSPLAGNFSAAKKSCG